MVEPWSYRNHAQFSVDESGRLGLLASRGHAVIPVERCLILHPLLDEIYAAFDLDWPELRRLSLRGGIHTGERLCVFEVVDDQAPVLEVDTALSCVLRLENGTDVALTGPGLYHEMLRGMRFRISAGSFFQVNTAQAEVLLDVVQEYLQPGQDDVLLDVYCGVGTLGLSFRATVGRVIGIEESRTAIADARVNAKGAEHIALLEGKARTVLPTLREDVSHVVLDPPRQGCHPATLQALLDLAPWRIVYVSCDPSTLGRDAVVLAGGGYELVEVQPVDMFPQTYHIETVSMWQRRRAAR
jgi:23S rRNA (uracil1939-C5)-methyltransferase